MKNSESNRINSTDIVMPQNQRKNDDWSHLDTFMTATDVFFYPVKMELQMSKTNQPLADDS